MKMNIKDTREVGFVKVEKGLCSVNYFVNMVVNGEEFCQFVTDSGSVINDHGMTDNTIYKLLGDAIDVKEITDKMVEIKISQTVSARIYKR